MRETHEQTYRVSGMTCDHCVASVRSELLKVAGVADVDIDLASGLAHVRGEGLRADLLRAAIAEAGYEALATA